MLLWLWMACKEELDCTNTAVIYDHPECYTSKDDTGETEDDPSDLEPDACLGTGFYREEGVLRQLCIECGSIICQYHVRTSVPIGGVEYEVAAPIESDPDWVEYHDNFELDDDQFGTHERRTLTLTLTDDPFAYVSNETTLFNVGVTEIRDAATLELSIMDTEGVYPECFILGNDPDFTDDCSRPDWE